MSDSAYRCYLSSVLLYLGKGVLKAVENVNTKIAPAVEGLEATDQVLVDQAMLKADGIVDDNPIMKGSDEGEE